MLCENVEWKDDKLMVTGYVRGAPISANRLVHVPGLGDFQVEIKGFGSIQYHPLTPQKTYFFENFQFSGRFSVFSKSRFFGGLRGSHGFQTFCGVLKYIGEDGFIIFRTNNGHFLREYRGGRKSPPPRD